MKTLYAAILSIFLLMAVAPDTTTKGYAEPFLKEFAVYPNPTSGALTLNFQAVDGSQSLDLKIYNLIGQEMYHESFAPFSGVHRLQLDLGDYPKGMYMVEISDGKQKRIKRISVI